MNICEDFSPRSASEGSGIVACQCPVNGIRVSENALCANAVRTLVFLVETFLAATAAHEEPYCDDDIGMYYLQSRYYDPETGETRPTEQVTVYTCLCVEVKTPATYAKLIQAMIRQRYSVDDEIAILRQKEDKPEEFQAWYEFAENCKATAREIEL